MDDLELTKTIAQVRRAMPRNEAVMTICSELERRVSLSSRAVTTALAKEAFDRKSYMRDYMKKKRAATAKRK